MRTLLWFSIIFLFGWVGFVCGFAIHDIGEPSCKNGQKIYSAWDMIQVCLFVIGLFINGMLASENIRLLKKSYQQENEKD